MYAELFASLFGAVGTMVASYFAFRANQVAQQNKSVSDEINDAVNHRHETGTPRLYDMVLTNYTTVADMKVDVTELKTDVKTLKEHVHDHDHDIEMIEQQLNDSEEGNQ